jgi:hypothetical protein
MTGTGESRSVIERRLLSVIEVHEQVLAEKHALTRQLLDLKLERDNLARKLRELQGRIREADALKHEVVALRQLIKYGRRDA